MCVCATVALVVKHAKNMYLILSSLACVALLYFSTLSRKRYESYRIVDEIELSSISSTIPASSNIGGQYLKL
jgi:hypothetical protein